MLTFFFRENVPFLCVRPPPPGNCHTPPHSYLPTCHSEFVTPHPSILANLSPPKLSPPPYLPTCHPIMSRDTYQKSKAAPSNAAVAELLANQDLQLRYTRRRLPNSPHYVVCLRDSARVAPGDVKRFAEAMMRRLVRAPAPAAAPAAVNQGPVVVVDVDGANQPAVHPSGSQEC